MGYMYMMIIVNVWNWFKSWLKVNKPEVEAIADKEVNDVIDVLADDVENVSDSKVTGVLTHITVSNVAPISPVVAALKPQDNPDNS